MIGSDNNGTMLVLELIGSDVNDQFRPLKPRVRLSSAIATYIIKLAAVVILKILGQQERGVTARATGKFLEPYTQSFRIMLHNRHNRLPEDRRAVCQFVYIKVDHRSGDVFVSADYPLDINRALKLDDESSQPKLESSMRESL